MGRPLLPVRGIFVGTRWLYDPQLSANIKETLLQLMALTWGSPSHTTPPLTYAQLEALTHKDARTLRGHFSALRTYHAALRLQRAGAGQFIIALAGWLFHNNVDLPGEQLPGGALHGKTSPQPVKDDQNQEEDLISLQESNLLPDPLNDHNQSPRKAAQPRRAARQPAHANGGSGGGLTRTFEERLLEAGVFPALLGEVGERAAGGGYSEAELAALLEWCQADQPDCPAGLFIGRLRAGARPPAAYRTPACPHCGTRGKHGPDCPRRYALDGL